MATSTVAEVTWVSTGTKWIMCWQSGSSVGRAFAEGPLFKPGSGCIFFISPVTLLFISLSFQRLFDDNFFSLSYFHVKLTWNESTFFMYCAFQKPVQTNFRQYLFYFSPDQTQNQTQTHLSLQGFKRTLRPNVVWIRQQVKIFPIDLHSKNLSTFDKNY